MTLRLLFITSLVFAMCSFSAFAEQENSATTASSTSESEVEVDNTQSTTVDVEETKEQDFSWQFSIDMAAVYDPGILAGHELTQALDYLALSLSLELYYKGFYIQPNKRRSGAKFYAPEIGYQLVDNEDWALDILARTYISGYSPEDIMDWQDEYIPILAGLEEKSSGDGIAIRYSKFFDNNVLMIEVANLDLISGAEGWVFESFFSHVKQVRNWDIYFGAGLSVFSDDVINYYFGIEEQFATPIRPQYQASTGFKGELEIFAQHPISENWSFNAGITQSYFSSSITDSPIVDSKHNTRALIGVTYVF